MKLKDLKGQPLLEAHLEEGGRKVTVRDIDAMTRMLNICRKNGDGLGICRNLFFMRDLGIQEEMTDSDIKLMDRDLQMWRRENAEATPERFNMMRVLGLPRRITVEDKKAMRDKVKELRERKEAQKLADMLYHMKELRVGIHATTDDIKLFKDYLEGGRRARDGLVISWTHFTLKGLGYGETVTKEDEKAMTSLLNYYRKDDPWYNLAWTHYCMNNILPPLEQTTDQIPPLKRFGR